MLIDGSYVQSAFGQSALRIQHFHRRQLSSSRPMRRATHDAELARRLDALYHDYNREDSASDPIQKVRPFTDPADREIAGFCAAALAFGRVASVLNSIDTLFACIGPNPAAFVRSFEPGAASADMRRMVHRWIRGEDLVALLWILRQMLERSGSIERFFLEGY